MGGQALVSTGSIQAAIARYDTSPAIDAVVLANLAVQRAPVVMAYLAERRTRQVRPLILKDAKTSDRRPFHPFIWSLNKAAQGRALRWWFANKAEKRGKGKGRYPRTGGMDKATQVTGFFGVEGGRITLGNPRPGSEFVFGDRQVPSFQRIHPYFRDVADKWRPIVSKGLTEDWYTATRGTGKLR